jgi:ubiquinone/menaquinone biosynthesis C-methylase UbiE
MARPVRIEEVYLGLEGTALLRHLLDGSDEFVARRTAAMRDRLAELDRHPPAAAVPELDVDAGYEAWAPSYDTMVNDLIRAEEPVVASAIDGLGTGRALDAACGTGRHTATLAAIGHETLGVDRSAAMLAIARQKVPGARFEVGELTRLPTDDKSFDLAVCALALTHLADPTPGIAELARSVRPGGRVVISDAHPVLVLIQGQALFPHRGGLAFVRNHVHLHGTYLAAFAAAGLTVRSCDEVRMSPDYRAGLFSGAAEAAAAIWDDLPAALVWTLERV